MTDASKGALVWKDASKVAPPMGTMASTDASKGALVWKDASKDAPPMGTMVATSKDAC